MGRKKIPGLFKRGDTWHIDKQIYGRRIRQSCGTSDFVEAEAYLLKIVEEVRQAVLFGVRVRRTFKQAATKFLLENQHKASIDADAGRLKVLVKYIGSTMLDEINMGTLQPFIDARRKEGIKTRTINHGLQVVRRILNLATDTWMDEYGKTWLASAPRISLMPEPDLRKPNPISWEEQTTFFKELSPHLANMALFAVNTGCRDQEICYLKWEWEIPIPELDTSVFLIPGIHVKNREDRLVILNRVALSVIDAARGNHSEYVFTYRGKPITRMTNSGWCKARKRTGIDVRVHDLKHTYGRRLRAAGVSFEDRQDLLGHKSGRITTHYSSAEIINLIEASNSVLGKGRGSPTLTLLKSNRPSRPHNIPTVGLKGLEKRRVTT